MATREEILDFFDANAETYRFLSQMLLKELTQEAIDELSCAEWPEDTGNDHLDRGYDLLRRYFAFSEGDRRSQLAVEYARIFLAAGVYAREKETAVPYESVFTSEEHVVMGESRDQVVAWFAEDGFQVDPELHEPEDHLSFELEYLSVMNERAGSLLRANDRDGLALNVRRQASFIDAHLSNWIGPLASVASEYAKTAFYLGMLEVTQGALEQTRAMLGEIYEHLPR